MAEWNGKPVVSTKSAYAELAGLGLGLDDVVKVLEEGWDFPRDRRKGVFEKCLDVGDETIKVVVAESFRISTREEVFAIIHVMKVKRR